MLERLTIKNLALISDAELEFCGNLNILSGETGAGKSIIVDALMLLLGGKYDKTMLSYGADSGFVEGVFSLSGNAPDYLEEYEAEDQLIVVRKFNKEGKNDIRINGRSVTAGMLKGITSHFIDICGQNEYQILSKKSEHAAILDSFCANELKNVLSELAAGYDEYAAVKKKLASLGNADDRMRRIDNLTYQINEIETANISENEEGELTELKQKISHGEKIKTALSEAYEFIDGEDGAESNVSKAVRSMSLILSLSDSYKVLSERISSVGIELGDIAVSLSEELSEVDFDPDVLEETENRLALIKNIRRKYGDISKLDAYTAKLKEELNLLENSDEMYDKLTKAKDVLLHKLYETASAASEIRRSGAKLLEKETEAELSTLGMGKAKFSVSFAGKPDINDCEKCITAKGFDDIEFYLSPNIGQPLLPLIKIISGGEMSRFMLALKVIASRFGNTETMIFDEIDTGISGQIGQEVAKKLASISRNCQVLCVTHLPQIASMADSHYFISKSDDGSTTKTNISVLSRESMIDEVSRLSGAVGITSIARSNASEMKKWSDDYKSSLN